MRYEQLKKFDLNSIKSEEEAIKWKDTVMSSNLDDKLKYLNFLRWQQFNKADIRYMNRIVQFLSFDEIIDFEKENSNVITGDTEDLVLLAETPKEEEKLSNPIYIDGKEYSVKSILEDDFESVMIVADREGLLYKFGFIVLSTLQGLELYAYELFEESQEYYKQIVDAKIGTKINVYCDIVGENQVTKTFKKSDLLIEEKSFVLATKTNKGIMSPVTKEGTFSILKKEDVLSADGISEDRLQSQISKYQQEMKERLGFSQTDIDNATQKSMEEEEKPNKKTKEDFVDDFKFSAKYHFSVVSPEDAEEYSHVNPLTHTVLEFNSDEKNENNRYFLRDDYVEEVYQLLYTMFGMVEDMEGIWSVENTKLERVIRKLVQAGAEVELIEENASDFLKNFIRNKKFERILNPVMTLNIVKTIKTKKDVEEFAKDSGTELYIQIGQVMTSVLEGTQRLYGEGHMVFDSNHKLIICKYDKLDLREASEYAIDNGYDNFYVIEKDKFQQYDAWYKEVLKNKVDEETETSDKEIQPNTVIDESKSGIMSNDVAEYPKEFAHNKIKTNDLSAENLIERLKKLFIPMSLVELKQNWTKELIAELHACIDALEEDKKAFDFNRTMIELAIKEIRDKNNIKAVAVPTNINSSNKPGTVNVAGLGNMNMNDFLDSIKNACPDYDEDENEDECFDDCEDVDLDEASEEIEQDFEENCGYEIGEDFIFAIYEEPTATNTLGDAKFTFAINPLSYWNNDHCQYDQHLEHFLRKKFPVLNSVGFEELAETTFDFYNDNGHFNLSETIDTLCKAGVKFKLDFQNFMSNKDTTQVVNMINQLGHQNCII